MRGGEGSGVEWRGRGWDVMGGECRRVQTILKIDPGVANNVSITTQFKMPVRGLDVLCNSLNVSRLRW